MELREVRGTEVEEGMILVHGVTVAGRRLAKGRVLNGADVALLRGQACQVGVAVPGPDDVHEDVAAARMSEALAGSGLGTSSPSTGRVNLIARAHGLLRLDVDLLRELNRLDEALTVATLAPAARVAPQQLVATVKVIPFAVAGGTLKAWLDRASGRPGAVAVDGFRPKRAALIRTRRAGTAEETAARDERKIRDVLARRLESLGGRIETVATVEHTVDALTAALAQTSGVDLVIVAAAVAPAGRHDVVPSALEGAGGVVEQLGMPVDPGNLLLLGRLGDRPVIGMPGCARSPKLNGFDWVLQRLCAGWTVGPRQLRDMGIGGLLKEIPSRPAPRSQAVSWPTTTEVDAVILAAGRSSRMVGEHKLLRPWHGRPMVSAVVDLVREAGLERPFLVSGSRHRDVEAAVAGRVRAVHNPDFALGMSTSLRRAIAALPDTCGGALICLGDMPSVSPVTLRALIETFQSSHGRVICVPTHGGRRGNPVLIGRPFFAEIHDIEGDRGAKSLLDGYPDAVIEVAVDDPGIFADVDTEQDLPATVL